MYVCMYYGCCHLVYCMYVCMYAEAIYVCIYVLRKYVVYMYVCMYVCMYNFIITDEQRHTCQQNHRDGHPNTG